MDDRTIQFVFQALDKGNKGFIEKTDLESLLSASGSLPTQSQIDALFASADKNNDGKLDVNDFTNYTSSLASKHGVSLTPVNKENRSFDSWETRPAKVISDLWIKELSPAVVAVPQVHKSQDPPHWKVLMCGGMAGAVSRTCTSPLERLKIMFQIQSMQSADKQYRGIVPSLVKMFKEEGIRGFWKGNFTNVLRIAPYSAVQFMSVEYYKSILRMFPDVFNSTGVSLVAGGFGSVTALIVTYPLDLVRTRLTVQVHETKYKGIGHTFRTVVQEEGFMALYKGVGTSAMGMAPYGAISFAVYDALRQWFVQNRSIGLSESLTYGGIAGAVAQTLTYPVDLLRRRMQLQGVGGAPVMYRNTADAIRQIVQKEGVRGLYQGMVPCYMKVIPSIAISFCTYEVMRKLLGIEQRKTNFGAG